MFRLRSTRPFSVRSFVHALTLLTLGTLCAAPAALAQAPAAVSGIVADPEGNAVVRARVRLVASDARELATTISDARGHFTLPIPQGGCAGCRIEASQPGFITGTLPLSPAGEVRLALAVAPVRESVVVTATRGEAPSGLVGSSVTVVEQEDIERRGTPIVSELLKGTPSVTAVRTGGYGSVTGLFVRGGESDYNKVLLDGIPLNEPGGTFNFSNLTTGGIGRIEIVRGAMSALFGSDAMSSVIQLFSARGRAGEKPRVDASFEGGSYDTYRTQAGISGGAGRWDYAVSGGRIDTDNRGPSNEFKNTTVTATAGGPIDGAGKLSLRGLLRVENQHAETPGATAFGPPDTGETGDITSVVGGFSGEHRTSDRWRQRAGFSISRSTQEFVDLVEDAPYTPSFGDLVAPFMNFDFMGNTRNEFRRYSTTYQSDWFIGGGRIGAQVITAALDIDTQRATLTDRTAGNTVPAARNNFGITLQHQITGARLSTSVSVRTEHNSSFGNAAVPRGSVGYLARMSDGALGDTVVRASAGLGIKEPTILENFSQNFFFRGNPDLLPERSKSFDAGIEQRLFGQHAKVELTWFDGIYRNQISTRVIDFSTFESEYFNVGKSRARGTELVVEMRPADAVHVQFGHTFLASEIVASTQPDHVLFGIGAWAFRRPRHSGFLNASVSWGMATVDLSGVFSSRRVDSDFSGFVPPIEEYNPPAVWTLGTRVRIAPQAEAFLRIENLTDQEYMDPVGYQTWRRTAHLGVRVTF